MIGYIYETTNKLNGKTYIGQKLSNVFITNYFGSGVLILKALAKYGTENFSHRLLAEADSVEELNRLERYYISKARSEGKAEYNIAAGGQHMRGYCWVHNGSNELSIDASQIDMYIALGFKLGRNIAPNAGRVYITKDGSNKLVLPDALDAYIKDGWQLGVKMDYVLPQIKGLKWIHNGVDKKLINPKDRHKYPNWEDGTGRHSNNNVSTKYIRGSIWIHNGNRRKRIMPQTLGNYPDWKVGFGPNPKISNCTRGKIWIHNGSEERRILPEDRNKYPEWQDGTSPNRQRTVWINNGETAKSIPVSDRHLYPEWQDGQGNCSLLKSKRMWINNGIRCKYILVTDRDKYPEWQNGQGSGTRNPSVTAGMYMWINDGNSQLRIKTDELNNYPGWNRGKLARQHMWIHNQIESKFIRRSERDQYPDWVEGHL